MDEVHRQIFERCAQNTDHEGQGADCLGEDDARNGIGETYPKKNETDADTDNETRHDQRGENEHFHRPLGLERDLG